MRLNDGAVRFDLEKGQQFGEEKMAVEEYHTG
jgi:hypothetical protein